MVVPLNPVETRGLTATLPEMPRIDGYEILAEIGSGGQGKVYEARQESTSRSVALKVLWGGSFPSEDHRRRFAAEIMHASILSHRGIAAVYDAGRSNGYDFIAYECVRGMDLENHPELYEASQTDIVGMMIKVCEGVAYLHRNGIIHRDLKPAHIIINEDGEPKIIDLGSSLNVASDVRITQTGDFVGTIAFAAPEQLLPSPDRPVDTRCDVYALGLIMYQLLTDQYAYDCPQGDKSAVFSAVVMREPVPIHKHIKIPRDLETIVHKCLQKDPERRYQTVVELLGDLKCFLKSEPISARRDSLLYRMKMFVRRRWPILSILVVAMLSIGFFWFRALHFAEATRVEQDTHIARLKLAQETEIDFRMLIRDLVPEANEYRRLIQLRPELAALSRLNLPVAQNPDSILKPVGELFNAGPVKRPLTETQRAGLFAIIDEVLTHRLEFPVNPSFWGEWEKSGYAWTVGKALFLDAERLFEEGRDEEAFLRLRASRSIALDLANTTSFPCLQDSSYLRHSILKVIQEALQNPSLTANRTALASSFIESDPPLPEVKYMFQINRALALQRVQWASFGGEGDEPAYVDSDKLLSEFRNPIRVDYVITVDEARAIVNDYYEMYERLTTAAPKDAVAQYNKYIDDHVDRPGFEVICYFFSTGSASITAAVEYPKLLESIRQSL